LAEASGRPEHAVGLIRRELTLRAADDPARTELLIRTYDLAARCGLDAHAAEALSALETHARVSEDPEVVVQAGLRGAHRAFISGDLAVARLACESALVEALDTACDEVACELAILSARIELRLGELDRSLARSVDAIARSRALARPDLEAHAQLAAGLVTINRREIAPSNAFAKQAVRAAKRTKDPILRSRAQRLQGNAHLVASRRQSALRSYRSAVREARQSGGIEAEAKALNNLAAVAASLGQISGAIEAWLRAIELKMRVGAVASAMVTEASMGGMSLLVGDRARARRMQQRIMDSDRIDARLAVSVAYSNRGDLEAVERNFGASIEAYDRSSDGYESLQMNSLRAHGLCGGVRSRLARAESGDLDAAALKLEALEALVAGAPTAAHERFAATSRAVYLDACGRTEDALDVAAAAARITQDDTVYEDAFASPVEAAWIVAVLRHRLGRKTARAIGRAQRRLQRSADRLDPGFRGAFLAQHPLHVAVLSGETAAARGTTW